MTSEGEVHLIGRSISSIPVIPNLRYAYRQEYEPGHLGVRDKY